MEDQSPHWPAQYPPVKRDYRVQTHVSPAMRAATADRERAVDVLKAGFAEGRLSQDEYTERMGKAYDARTYGELAALTADLPAGPMPLSTQHVPVGPPARANTNSMALASMILGLGVPLFALTAIPAIVTGHKARQEIRRTGEQGDGMAVVGMMLGYLALIVGVLFLFTAVAWGVRHGHPFPGGRKGPGAP